MSSRYLIIHGHFYQPPRENPWIGTLEPQESAAPFADWNERINRECYAPNTSARLLDAAGNIVKLVNNYEYLSFNFGPTLLSWLQKADPATYQKIIEADKKAAQERLGHGPALAQVYNHLIMPLANYQDRLTQIKWGVLDFSTRFGRKPEGMWLAETAVDLETLRLMKEEGLKFTILAQNQAEAVRLLTERDGDNWQDASGGRIDPREPYRAYWGSGPDDYLDVFFYDGPVSQSIAFEQLLRDGSNLRRRIEEAFGEPHQDGTPRLVNLATDGESYGHHFQFGEMALAWLFDQLENDKGQPDPITITNYGQYLELFPPTKEVRIFENSSWSCVHGVERWRSNCGCNLGGPNAGSQQWRKPLREGLNWLRDEISAPFIKEGERLLKDPWAARNDYIKVVISNYDSQAQDELLRAHQKQELSSQERTLILSLLEGQLMGQFMFTSCGWFFDEFSGLEPVQNLRYALRAIELTQEHSTVDLSQGLLDYLKTIQPNNHEYASGSDVWQELVLSDSLGSDLIAAHWTAGNAFNVPELKDFFHYPSFLEPAVTHLGTGEAELMAASISLYDQRLQGTRNYLCGAAYSKKRYLLFVKVVELSASDPPAHLEQVRKDLIASLATHLKLEDLLRGDIDFMPEAQLYTLADLQPHCRHILLTQLLTGVYDELKSHAKDLFNLNQRLILLSRSTGAPLTWAERFLFRVVGEAELKRLLKPQDPAQAVDLASLHNLLKRQGFLGLAADEPILKDLGELFCCRTLAVLPEVGDPLRLLKELKEFLALVRRGHFAIDLWQVQNIYHKLLGENTFLAHLSPEEKELWQELGSALGFAQSVVA